jgi:hypothetical protein
LNWNAWMTKGDRLLGSGLDQIWGAWEAEAELTNDPRMWLKQSSLSRDDLRYHVEKHASHREQRWEQPSASLIERTQRRLLMLTL